VRGPPEAVLSYDTEQLRKHYGEFLEDKPEDYFERFDPFILDERPRVKELLARTFERVFAGGAGELLDVGCGTCFYYPLLARHAKRVTGIDLSPAMIEVGRDLIEQKGLANCRVQEGSALEIPFEDASFDTVHSWDFLHHSPDIALSASEIARVLRPGGRYVAVEPNVLNPSIFWFHARRRVEWGLFSQNHFTIPAALRKHFDVEVTFDNTIIGFLEDHYRLWKLVDGFTSFWPTRYLSFRYVLECRKRGR